MAVGRKKTPALLTDPHVAELAGLFAQLADKNRLKILLSLAQEGELHVSALCAAVNQSQPAVSHHLTLLRMAGLVSSRRQGKFNYYCLDGSAFAELLDEVFTSSGRAGRVDFDRFSLAYARTGRRR